jgi:hypothetical protein
LCVPTGIGGASGGPAVTAVTFVPVIAAACVLAIAADAEYVSVKAAAANIAVSEPGPDLIRFMDAPSGLPFAPALRPRAPAAANVTPRRPA